MLAPRPDHKDFFRVTGTAGHILVEGGTLPTLLYGVNWYLKYVAHLQVSTNGVQLGNVGLTLPAPHEAIEKQALYLLAIRSKREKCRRLFRALLG